MKLLMENWRKFLAEEKLPLGKVAFANDDDDEENDEPDTGLESMLIKALQGHFGPDKQLKKNTTDAIINLIDKRLYPDVFQRVQEGDIYMGFYAPKEYYEKSFGPLPKRSKWYRAPIDALMKRAKKTFKDNSDAPSYVPRQKETTQTSLFPDLDKRTASSWTTDIGTAKSFADSADPSDGEVSIILIADASNPDNYFISSEPLYKFDFAEDFRGEAEVLGVGDIKIKELVWLYGYYDEWRDEEAESEEE